MSTMPAEVDTSLTSSTGMETGMPGIDSFVSPDLSPDMLPVATRSEFAGAFYGSDSPQSFQFFANQDMGDRGAVVQFAKQFLGTPYVWGGTTPQGFDCSGFTQYVAARFGVRLPRVSQQQANAGDHVDVRSLLPGDLVLFPGDSSGGRQGPGHVALYIGGGQIIEAPHAGATVRIRDLGKNENVFGVHVNYPGR